MYSGSKEETLELEFGRLFNESVGPQKTLTPDGKVFHILRTMYSLRKKSLGWLILKKAH